MSMMGTGVSMTNTLHSMLKGLAPAAAAQAVQTAAQNGVQAMSSLGSSLGSSGLGARDDRPLLGYDTPTGLTCPYTTPLDVT